MQPLTAAPRAGLSADEVEYLLLEAPNVTYSRGLDLLAADLTVIGDLTDSLEAGSVTRTMNADVHGTCALTLTTDIDYMTQLVRPAMTLAADGLSAQFYLGVYLLRKPSTTYGSSVVTNSVAGSDRMWLLNRPVGDSWVAPAGQPVISEVLRAIAAAGLTGALIDGTASAVPLPADQVWPLLGTTGDGSTASGGGSTTWLQIINTLLGMIAYRGMWCDWMGLFRSEPYVSPGSRGDEFALDYDDPQRVTIQSSRTVVQDLSSVPNRWEFFQQSAVDPTVGAGLYVVDRSAIVTAPGYRGGLVWAAPAQQVAAADQASLVALGDAAVANDEAAVKTITVSASPFPAAWHWDLYSYSDVKLGGPMRVEETAWTLDLGQGDGLPADMQRTWSVVG